LLLGDQDQIQFLVYGKNLHICFPSEDAKVG
jgi:hypothetical protein